MKVLFTHRPPSKRLMSFINLFTRIKTKCPFDHVAVLHNGFIYESVAKSKLNPDGGVHRIDFDKWKSRRSGSWILEIEVPANLIDLAIFEEHKGEPYDYKANWYWLTNQLHKLKKEPSADWYCSEIIARAMKKKDFYLWTPGRLAKNLKEYKTKLNIYE